MAINRNDWINQVKQDAYGETGNPAQLSTALGSAPSYSARAWVNFNGTTNSILASRNVSSITDNGVGDYTVNFTTPMPDQNYAAGIFNSFLNFSTYHIITGTHPTVSPTNTQFRVLTRRHSAGTDQEAAETAFLGVVIFA